AVDQREDTLGRHQHALHRAGYFGEALDRVEYLPERRHERGEAADRQPSVIRLIQRHGDHRSNGHRNEELRYGGHGGVGACRTHGKPSQPGIHVRKAAALALVAVEQLNDALAIDAFLNHTGELRIHADGVAVDTAQPPDKQPGRINRHWHDDQNNEGELPRHVQEHDEQRQHDQTLAYQHRNDFGGVLGNVAGIDGEAVQQATRVAAFVIFVGHAQQPVEHVAPNAQQHVVGHPGEQIGAGVAGYAAQQNQPDYGERNGPHIIWLCPGEPLVEQRFGNDGQGGLGGGRNADQNDRQDNGLPVFAEATVDASPQIKLDGRGLGIDRLG